MTKTPQPSGFAPPKTAVVTGSTGGIGRELVHLLAADGWHVVSINRNAEKAACLDDELRRAYPSVEVTSYTADLRDPDAVRPAVDAIKAAHPEIGLLVNNAGVLTPETVITPSGLDLHAQVNLIAPVLLTLGLSQPLAAGAARHGRAVVVTPASSAVSMGRPLIAAELERPVRPGLFGAYAQSKLAAAVLVARLAPAFAERNIELYAIDPGGNRTAMTAGPAAPFFIRWMWRLLPHPRKGAARLLAPIQPGWNLPPGATVSGGKPRGLPNRKLPPGEADRTWDLVINRVRQADPSGAGTDLLTSISDLLTQIANRKEP